MDKDTPKDKEVRRQRDNFLPRVVEHAAKFDDDDETEEKDK